MKSTEEDNPPKLYPDDENKDRGNWTSQFDYILSLVGMSIDLSIVWRFPYLCYKNGGGAFLIPYFIFLAVIGVPVFFLEVSTAQFSSSTVLKIYDLCPAFRGSGICSIIVTFVSTIYYCVVVAYPLIYIWYTITSSTLPWTESVGNQDDEVYDMNEPFQNITLQDESTTGNPSENFFRKTVLQMSTGFTDIGYPVLSLNIANIIVWIVVFVSIFKGVKILGKVVWFTALFPFSMLVLLLIRGLTLPGASLGLKMYLIPNFESLGRFQVWSDAGTQIIFTLGPAWGSLHCLGSYNKYRNNSVRDAIFLPIIIALTSFCAGLVVFSVLGFMSYQLEKPIEEVVAAGRQTYLI